MGKCLKVTGEVVEQFCTAFHTRGFGFDHCSVFTSLDKNFCPHLSLSTQVYQMDTWQCLCNSDKGKKMINTDVVNTSTSTDDQCLNIKSIFHRLFNTCCSFVFFSGWGGGRFVFVCSYLIRALDDMTKKYTQN